MTPQPPLPPLPSLTPTIDVTATSAPLKANDPAAAAANTLAIQALLDAAPPAAAIHFPAGDYYFNGAGRPNHGTIESSHPGQIIYGDGPGVTNLIQCDARPDFGFTPRPDFKRVPAATIRLRHKACAVRGLSVIADPRLPALTILGSAAIQIAHIKYFPDNNIGIVEADGLGDDFLIDHVVVSAVSVGRNLGMGIVANHFFEVGVDIVGSGGHVRLNDMDRLDANIGIRLDNGNHCGQGEYLFRNCHMIGRVGVTGKGVFFDWVGGQAPQLEMCSTSFMNGFHAGPLGVAGDRFEPNAESKVHRAPDRDWDWLTWHPHAVVADPNPAQRMEWYGLPRQTQVTRIGAEPRTGGAEWAEGRDYRIEQLDAPADFKGVSKIHWLTANRPAPGSAYYVTFQQPKEYRVQDLEWGNLMNCSFQEANQAGAGSYTAKFEDQGYGIANPDFFFRVGYGFALSHTFTIDGDLLFEGAVDGVSVDATTGAVCNVRIRGLDAGHPATNLNFNDNRFNSIEIDDFVERLTLDNNDITGHVRLNAPTSAREVSLTRNRVHDSPDTMIALTSSRLENVRVQDNTLASGPKDGLALTGAIDGLITGNRVSALQSGAAIRLTRCTGLSVMNNLLTYNREGLVTAPPDTANTILESNNQIRNLATPAPAK